MYIHITFQARALAKSPSTPATQSRRGLRSSRTRRRTGTSGSVSVGLRRDGEGGRERETGRQGDRERETERVVMIVAMFMIDCPLYCH